LPGLRATEDERREQIVSAAYHVALRTGIDGVTLRAVAAKAKLSHGLVVFYFRGKDSLIDALLDRVLATTAILHVSADVAKIPHAPQRFGALLRQELRRLASDPRGTRLFFEYWALGVRKAGIRQKIAAALERYRAAIKAMAEEMLPTTVFHDSPMTPVSLAALAVSLISGCAVQAMMDPTHFDAEAYLTAFQRLFDHFASREA